MNQDVSVYSRRADFGARILVVDDDATTRRTLRAMLEKALYKVECAASGAEALALLPEYRPELVLLDVLMPDMDGLETCRRIRTLPGGDLLPVVFLTSDLRPETHAEAFRAKCDDFLRKPVFSTELIVRIRSLMRLKRLQAEIHAERDALLDSQKQKEQLLEFIVHDLKNPLATLQVGLDMLGQREDIPATVLRQLVRLRETALSMDQMIQNILDIGRAEQTGLDLHRTRIRMFDLIPMVLREVELRAQKMEQNLAWDCAEELAIEADQELLRRLLLNLLDNALKYSPKGSRTRIEAGPKGNGIVVKVSDEGQGIPEHMRDAVFSKFVRLEEEGASVRSSSGLGLTFCQVVAEAHGGRIWVEANLPKGSVFILELPNEVHDS
jgi:signal transduction histidine kinase